MKLLFVIYILFIPFFKDQYESGIREFVSSPEDAFHRCKEADSYESMPNGSRYAKLFKINFNEMKIEEVDIPSQIILSR